MIQPSRAPVSPRVISPEINQAVPLEDVWLDARRSSARAVEIVGGIGAGKTTALAHLAAVAPPHLNVLFLDDTSLTAAGDTSSPLVVFTSSHPQPSSARSSAEVASYRLAPWGDDELVEYLLAVHPARCRSVMARLQAAPDRRLPAGLPELWRVVLDRMAADETLTSVAAALRRELQEGLPTAQAQSRAEEYCLAALTRRERKEIGGLKEMRRLGVEVGISKLLRHDAVRLLLATDYLGWLLEQRRGWRWLQQWLPRALLKATAAAASPAALENLARWLDGRQSSCHAMAASLLHAAGRGWLPNRRPLPRLTGACLDGAEWKGLDLTDVQIAGSDLSNSDLTGAVLDGAARCEPSSAVACCTAAPW